jgi:mannosyltransferase
VSGFGRPAATDGAASAGWPGKAGGAGRAQTGVPPSAGPGHPDDRWPWLALVPAAVTLVIGLIGIRGPSFTRDETATLAAVHRSFPQLVRMLGHVDVVHGAYYALIWLMARTAGSGELAVRLPSAIAMAVAAGFVAALGRWLVSTWAGLAAGLAFAVLPSVSWFAQNAREGAIVTALGTMASYCLVRAWHADRHRRRWLAAYGVVLAALGFANLFGLVLVVAHAITLATSRRGDRAGRGFALGWLLAVAAAVVVVSPVAIVGYGQLNQIHWLQPTRLKDVLSVQRIIGQPPLFLAAVVIVACALVVSALPGAGFRARWPAGLVRLCLPWLVVPPAILLAVSVAHPVYTFRYIVYCIPAAALLLGAALAALGRYAGPVALVAIVLIGLHTQIAERRPDGHGINIRAADRIVAARERPGDALLNISSRSGPQKGSGEHTLEAAYPYGLARLRDISTGVSPQRSGTLGGTYASSQLIRRRLAHVRRLWVVEWTTPRPVLVLDGLPFRLVHRWDVKSLWLRLFVRHHPA